MATSCKAAIKEKWSVWSSLLHCFPFEKLEIQTRCLPSIMQPNLAWMRSPKQAATKDTGVMLWFVYDYEAFKSLNNKTLKQKQTKNTSKNLLLKNVFYNSTLFKALFPDLLESVALCEYGLYLMDDSGEGAERTAGQGGPLHLSSQGWLGHMLFASLHSLSLDLWCCSDWWAPPGQTAQWRRSIQTIAQPIHLESLVESHVTVRLVWCRAAQP